MEIRNSQKIIIQQLSGDLEDLENYIKDLWQFLPLPVCYINPFQIILDANSAAEEFFGWRASELIGEKIEKLFVEKVQSQKIYQKILEAGKITNQESRVLTKANQEKFVNISATTRREKKGAVIGYYLAFFDVSELKKLQVGLEKRVEERTKELQGKVQELEKLNRLATGRELKMVDLKKEITRLKKELKKKAS